MRLPNGYGGVIKLSGKRRKPYCARITAGWEIKNEKERQIYKILGYYASRQEALSVLAEYHKDPYKIESNITFSQLYDKWSDKKYNVISDSNINGYKAAYASCKILYNMVFANIRKVHLQEVLDNSGKNYPSRKKIQTLFSQMYNYAMENDIIEKDYSNYTDLGTKEAPKIIHKPYSNDEIQKLWEHLEVLDFIDVILITIYSGTRPSEILGIKVNNVHLNERYMIGGIKTDAGKDRIIPINNKILPLIKKRYDYAIANNAEYLILNFKNEKMKYDNFKREKFDNIMEQLNLDHLPHDGRHTCATLLDRAGANKLAIKRILGHSTQDITDSVYTHKDIEDLLEAIDLI